VFDIMVSAYGTWNQEFQAFIKFSCGLFVPIGWLGGEAEGSYMDGMPEKGSPDFWRDMHSISGMELNGREQPWPLALAKSQTAKKA